MKYVDEFRDKDVASDLVRKIGSVVDGMNVSSPVRIMEICGGQTHSILMYGIEAVLSSSIEFIHGPGCPVCVTPIEKIDLALELARRPGVILASFGDMLRVPGSDENMFEAKATGADIRWVYSPLEAVEIAKSDPQKEVVFFAIGFETTTAPLAAALHVAERDSVKNFSLLTAMVRVPPALELLLSDPDCVIDGILAAGHVCTVMGSDEYAPIAEKHRVPIAVTGFQPVEILMGVLEVVEQISRGEATVRNTYAWVAKQEGNSSAKALIEKYFCVIDRNWRGIGMIPQSGFGIRDEYSRFDAEKKFRAQVQEPRQTNKYCGLVLQGKCRPSDCPFFGKQCTQTHPVGAPMVSSEGACAAYFTYQGVRST